MEKKEERLWLAWRKNSSTEPTPPHTHTELLYVKVRGDSDELVHTETQAEHFYTNSVAKGQLNTVEISYYLYPIVL